MDGCDYNFSWNCGLEGKTRKSSVVKLRKRMMKNALFLVFTSKGTPLIFAGDEICNTQNGTNGLISKNRIEVDTLGYQSDHAPDDR